MFSAICSLRWWGLVLLTTGMVLSGCKRSAEAHVGASASAAVSHTEEAWMVQRVCQSLADFASVARKANAPTAEVIVRKLSGAVDDATYEVIVAGKAHTLSITQGVWNPVSYAALAKEILTTADNASPALADMEFAGVLLSPDFNAFVAHNQRLSSFLTEHPASASGHVQAAWLVGTIALNDYSGDFRDVRIPINRMIAHLAAADALSSGAPAVARQLVESIRLTLCGQQVDALESLKGLSSAPEASVDEWAAILRLRNTCDWREDRARALAGGQALKQEYFRALTRSLGCGAGLQFLKDANANPAVGYWRIANEGSLSVSHGHVFSKPILGIELQESAAGAKAFGIKVETTNLNWLKEYAGTAEGSSNGQEAGQVTIDVAGRNLLAGYHLRHLMQAGRKAFGFLNDNWGVKESADELKTFLEEKLPETRYTPFLKRMIARTDASRREANKPCEIIIRDHPEMVTPTLWTALRDDQNQKWVLSCPDHHAWFRPELPRGTVFGVDDRLYEIGVGDENDAHWLKLIWTRVPYSYPMGRQNAYLENGSSMDNLSPASVIKWMGPLVEFDLEAMRFLAASYKGQPELYLATMEKAAAFAPDLYLELGDYLEELGLHDKAAQVYLQAFANAEDRVYMANRSLPLVKYLYEKNDLAKATEVAEDAAEVFSYLGLETHIWLLEKQGKWKEALEVGRKIDERYNSDGAVAETSGLIRMSQTDMAGARALGYDVKVASIFPAGVQSVTLADFKTAPKRGVSIDGSSKQMVPFGLEANMVIVALNGKRTDTFAQYKVVREMSSDPQMSLIVWDGAAYRTSEGSLPGKRFGVEMTDYVK